MVTVRDWWELGGQSQIFPCGLWGGLLGSTLKMLTLLMPQLSHLFVDKVHELILRGEVDHNVLLLALLPGHADEPRPLKLEVKGLVMVGWLCLHFKPSNQQFYIFFNKYNIIALYKYFSFRPKSIDKKCSSDPSIPPERRIELNWLNKMYSPQFAMLAPTFSTSLNAHDLWILL